MSTAGESDGLGFADSDLLHRNPPLPDRAIAKTIKYHEHFKREKLIVYLLFKSIIKAILIVNTICIMQEVNFL